VSVNPVTARLDDTITARWRRQLIGSKLGEKPHWRTKTAYYSAIERLLMAGAAAPVWSDVTRAVLPRGSRSTFYEVTGAHAKYPLIGAFLADGDVDAMQLALCYQRGNAVEQLIDETKVWSYWPHRDCLVMRYRIELDLDLPGMAQLLIDAVTDWARRNDALAVALEYVPPACAVEDLVVLGSGQLSATYAFRTLRRVVVEAVTSAMRGRMPDDIRTQPLPVSAIPH